ncbi:hypothetical protein [Amycolatopsis sp. NBC_01480]|uniref:hypothetical protein n=1 Tax=Amycolatopsis sp. NBC_01480 TaxID=2903562 RepID=UPI002E29B7C3|nr:hypothetical protein [Amycolatopsis sp. NBC_01480]
MKDAANRRGFRISTTRSQLDQTLGHLLGEDAPAATKTSRAWSYATTGLWAAATAACHNTGIPAAHNNEHHEFREFTTLIAQALPIIDALPGTPTRADFTKAMRAASHSVPAKSLRQLWWLLQNRRDDAREWTGPPTSS